MRHIRPALTAILAVILTWHHHATAQTGQTDQTGGEPATPPPPGAAIRIPGTWQAAAQDKQKAAAAWQIISRYIADAPDETRALRIAYITFNDRPHAPNHRERLHRVFDNIRQYYADQLAANGLPPLQLALERHPDGQLLIHEIHVNRNTAGLNQQQLHQTILDETTRALAARGIDLKRERVLMICSGPGQGGIPLDGFSRVLMPDGHAYGWIWDHATHDSLNLPCARPGNNHADGKTKTPQPRPVNYCGITAHETGHLLLLGHGETGTSYPPDTLSLMGGAAILYGHQTTAKPEQPKTPEIIILPAHAVRMAAQPLLNRKHKPQQPGRVTLTDIRLHNTPLGTTFEALVHVQGPVPCCAVAVHLYPAFTDDYKTVISYGVPDRNGRVSFHIDIPRDNRYFTKVETRYCFANGNSYGDWYNGWLYGNTLYVPDFEDGALYQPVTKAWAAGDLEAARMAYYQLKHTHGDHTWYTRRETVWRKALALDPEPTSIPPSDAADNPATRQIGLDRLTPVSAAPDRRRPRISNNTLFPGPLGPQPYFDFGDPKHYIAYMSPGTITYNLDRRWTRLTASFGAPLGIAGKPLKLRVIGDGKTLYQTDDTPTGRALKLSIDLQNIKHLQLQTEGADNALGLLINPVISR